MTSDMPRTEAAFSKVIAWAEAHPDASWEESAQNVLTTLSQELADMERELNEAQERAKQDHAVLGAQQVSRMAAIERAERAEAIAQGWAEAADRARQPDAFYNGYSEGTMRAMQAMLRTAEAKLTECMAHADAMASSPNQELLNKDREAYRTWRTKQ